jgi:Putative beta-barrel porin-2, OmpL-like. bbp2
MYFKSLTVFLICIGFLTNAQDATDKKNPLVISGYVDTYYSANLNKPKSQSNMGASNGRVFDQRANTFQLGLAQIKTTYSTDKVDGVVDLVFGNTADLNNYGNVASFLTGANSTALAVKQAYITYKATDKFSITAGQFGTHIGYEVTDAPLNFSYSLSNLFNNGPFYHTGVKATYAFSSKASLMAGLVNGVDSKDDMNKGKGIISQLFVSPKENWNVYLNYIGSDEGIMAKSYYSLLDLTTSYQITPKYQLGLNAATGSQDSKTWSGVAVYSNYSISDKFGLGGRYEYFDNKSGVRALLNKNGAGTNVSSYTITGNVILSENLFFKPELRIDAYPDKDQFEDASGNFSKSSQTTLGLALVFKY